MLETTEKQKESEGKIRKEIKGFLRWSLKEIFDSNKYHEIRASCNYLHLYI